MDGAVERHMDVLERPPELQATHRSASYLTFPERPILFLLQNVQS